ncbi:MAG: O-antigen ligase family protein [Candidatus Moraniibacteriota bacterium]
MNTRMNLRKYLPVIGMSAVAKMLLTISGTLFGALVILSYGGIIPLGMSDFVFLFLLTTLAAAYRPGWVFLLLVSVLPIEIVNLAPASFGSGIHPYQFLMVAIFVGLGIRILSHRSVPSRPRVHVGDFLLLLVPIGSVFAAFNAPAPGVALRFSIILFSFYALYVLFRLYVRSSEDVGRILPFAIVSALLTVGVSIVQNGLFLGGNGFFEVMPGRPNGLFAEPDWLGMYLVPTFAIFLSAGYFIASRSSSVREFFRMKRSVFLSVGSIICLATLIISVSRSAWLGVGVTAFVAIGLALLAGRPRVAGILSILIAGSAILAFDLVALVPLTDFDLFGRAESIGSGRQTITVSCEQPVTLPEHVASVDELAPLGCRHINLEEIGAEYAAGRFVSEIDRDDPNVSIRKQIYDRSLALGREHPVLGVGWGTVTRTLGADARGAGLNASDLFLEVWLGSGLLGLLGLVGLLLLLAFRSVSDFFRHRGTFAFFLLTAFAGLVTFDMLNSGILLGFFFALLGIAGSYLFHESDFAETL